MTGYWQATHSQKISFAAASRQLSKGGWHRVAPAHAQVRAVSQPAGTGSHV
jgi:hypothetical protein